MRAKQAFAHVVRGSALAGLTLLAAIGAAKDGAAWADENDPFIPRLINSSTIPSNGDVNPYGVAFVPEGFPGGGSINAGDVLVSNFNNGGNTQGTGTTIIAFSPGGTLATPMNASTFFTSVSTATLNLSGLSTALGVLRGGFVVVGNVSTTDGTFATIAPGALQVIDRNGNLLHVWTDPVALDGPWDLTIDDQGAEAHIFVSNVLNGTVARLHVAVSAKNVTLLDKVVIATGYTSVPNQGAVILGPTGLALDKASDTLYVASTGDNAIYAVPRASSRMNAVVQGSVVFANPNLRGPLALRFAPNGDLLTANGDAVNGDTAHPSEIVEFTKGGVFVRQYNVDASQGGAFGIDTVADSDGGFNYAVIDDVTNNLSVYRLPAD